MSWFSKSFSNWWNHERLKTSKICFSYLDISKSTPSEQDPSVRPFSKELLLLNSFHTAPRNSRIRVSHHKEVKMKTRTRLSAANGIAPELLPSSFFLYSFAHFLERKRRWLGNEAGSTGRPSFGQPIRRQRNPIRQFLFLYSSSRAFPRQAKLAPDQRGNSVVTEVDYRTGAGKNLAKGSISDSSPTVHSRDSILFYAR